MTTRPRSKLKSGSGTGQPLQFAAAEYVKFHDVTPKEASTAARTWYARGQNFVVAYTT